jgi:FlaA1/EpsC-like NDP-sugar epimerase
MLSGKNVVVFGGTGSLGKLLVKRLLAGECGRPKKVVVVSRDEAKQHQMRLDFQEFAEAQFFSFELVISEIFEPFNQHCVMHIV